jgi:hypothetical protein
MFSLVLHSTLIAIHLALLAVWSRGLEHRVIFDLGQQRKVSFLITAITTTFGTVCAFIDAVDRLLICLVADLFGGHGLRHTDTLHQTERADASDHDGGA